MPVRDLPPSCFVVCDGCDRYLNTGSSDYDYSVFDRADLPTVLMDYDWIERGGKTFCFECGPKVGGDE